MTIKHELRTVNVRIYHGTANFSFIINPGDKDIAFIERQLEDKYHYYEDTTVQIACDEDHQLFYVRRAIESRYTKC